MTGYKVSTIMNVEWIFKWVANKYWNDKDKLHYTG